MRGLWRPKNIAIGQMVGLNKRNKLVKKGKLTIKVNRASKKQSSRSTSTFGTLNDWTREELEVGLGNIPNLNIDDLIGKERGKKRKRRKKKKVSYKEKRLRLLQSWKDHRQQILHTYVAGEVLPQDTVCCKCTNLATHRCVDCGIHQYFCDSHVQEVHQDCLHVPEKWQVSVYITL